MSNEELPVFKFALREDIKDDIRFLPKKAEALSTGYDACAAFEDKKNLVVRAGQYVKIPLGFRAFCPPGWWYKLSARSSTFTKKSLHCLYGIVDESYGNQVYFCADFLPDVSSLGKDLVIEYGEPLCQLVPVKREDMEIVSISNEEINKLYAGRKTDRIGGFGSSDIKNK